MEEILFDMIDFVKRPLIAETLVDVLLCAVPIWLAVMIGLVIGWSWRPRWTGLVFLGLRSKLRFVWTAPPGFGTRRLWLFVAALSAFFSVCRTVVYSVRNKGKGRGSARDEEVDGDVAGSVGHDAVTSPSINPAAGEHDIVTENDLERLLYFVEGKVGEMEWQCFMERSTPNMSYQASRHDSETGPTVYRSKTVFEDATPELVRDFFWDDEFRPKWDPMLAYFKILEECPHTGTMIIHWIKKFPFFCSDREYIIGRRIWEAGKTYYCVTKAVPYPALQKRDKPRRVEQYFSSWIIRPVESRKGDGQLSACEVTLLHYEDMGIPKDVAKLGVRHGMWGAVKKLHSGLRSYQNARKSEASLSRCALMARITTKISFHGSHHVESGPNEEENARAINREMQRGHGIDWKWVAIGTVALACGLRTGVIGKALLLGAGRRIAQQ